MEHPLCYYPVMEAFLLGFSNGGACIAYCAPVLVPYLLGQGRGIAHNAGTVFEFLVGRLAGYALFSLFAYGFHLILQNNAVTRSIIIGIAYIALSVFLIVGGFRPSKAGETGCAVHFRGLTPGRIHRFMPHLAPAVLGFLTGLTLCPPFLIAFAAASQRGSIIGGFVFFLFFFFGTSVFFVPFPLIGTLTRFRALAVIGRLSMGIVGAWYLYSGLVMLAGVIK